MSFDLNEWVAVKAIKIGKSVIDGIVDGVGGVGGKDLARDQVQPLVARSIMWAVLSIRLFHLGKKLVSAIADGLKSLHIPLPHFTIKIKKS